MYRSILLLFILMLGSFARGADVPPAVVRIQTVDGKPAAGAKVWVYAYGTAEGQTEPKPLVADTDGKVSVPLTKESAEWPRQLFARDAAGHIGWSLLSPRDVSEEGTEVVLFLIETSERAGRITGPDGKPIVGAVVTPTVFSAKSFGSGIRGPGLAAPKSIGLPPWEQQRLAVRTDGEGRFKLLTPSSGYSVSFRVKVEVFGESRWLAPSGIDLDMQLSKTGTVTVTATGVEVAKVKGIGFRLSPQAELAEKKGVRSIRHVSGSFNDAGKATIENVFPGKYNLTIDQGSQVPAVFEKAEPFEITSGKTTAVVAKFGPAATATGRITDKETGKGIAKVQVIVNVSDGQSSRPQRQFFVETDKDGAFTAHGPSGWYAFWLQTAPEGYATPPPTGPRRRGLEPVKVDVGKTHEFPSLALPRAVTFVGQVVTVDGKPAAGATVSGGNFGYRGQDGKVTTDKDGHFAIKNLAPDDAVAPRVQLGTAVNVPQTFELEKTKPVTIEVSEANAVGFKGRVLDTKGKPVPGARIQLQHGVQGVGRNAEFTSYGPVATTTADAQGRYSFNAYWPRDRYGVHVTADGYTESEAKELVGEAGQVMEFPAVKLTRANLTLHGTVVGPDGKPLSDVEVFGLDGPSRFTTTSAADGTFALAGFHDNAAFVFARKSGYRLAAVPVFPARPDLVRVSLAKADGSRLAAPEIPADHRAALNRFTRHSLTLVWDNHATFGYGGNALTDMARIDPEVAKKWRDAEKARTDDKTDFTRRIDKAQREKTLFQTAREDVDEALGIIGGLSADEGFSEAIRIGELLLPVDKAKALRMAEEAVVKARQRELPAKIWAMAEAGDLAQRAGSESGKKILAEAAELATKLPTDPRSHNALAITLAAAHLAPHDWPKAETLLNVLKDPSDYNRCLSAAVARIARSDLDRARKLLGRFKPDNSYYPQDARLRIAFAVAKEKPDEAEKVVQSVSDTYHRVLGMIQLAVLFAPTDKPRAMRMIDSAFDLIDRDPEAFRSWSNFGGRAGLAAIGTVRAKEIGHPDVASLVARTLALRPTGQDAWSLKDREDQLVNIAAVLAMVDPVAARHVLAGIAPLDEFVERAVSERREWLFALALADPQRAITLADKLIERAKAARGGRNALSDTGLVELGGILTARDRLRELTRFGSLPREIDGD